MKTVNVLRDQSAQLSSAVEVHESAVPGVRLGVADIGPVLDFLPPVLDAAIPAGHELVEVHGAILGPHSVGTPEIRDARFRGDARTRKSGNPPARAGGDLGAGVGERHQEDYTIASFRVFPWFFSVCF